MEKFLRKIQLVTKMNPGNVIPWPAYHWFKALKGSCFQESQVRTLKTVAISSPSAYPILNSLIHLSTASTVYHLQQYFWSISRLFELLSKLFRNVIRHAYSNLPTGTWKVILITCARGHRWCEMDWLPAHWSTICMWMYACRILWKRSVFLLNYEYFGRRPC